MQTVPNFFLPMTRLLIVFVFLASCANVEEELIIPDTSGYLNHLIFFDLIDSLDVNAKEQFMAELFKLEDISEVVDFQAGMTKDVGDKRALPGVDCTMSMKFEDETAYRAYQNHEVHLAVKSALGSYLKRAPGSIDFYSKN